MNFDIRAEHQKTVQFDAESENRDCSGYSAGDLKFDVRLSKTADVLNIQKSNPNKPVISIIFNVN